VISSEAKSLLQEILDHEKDSDYWKKRFEIVDHREDSILRGCFSELSDNKCIKVLWADNYPFIITVMKEGYLLIDNPNKTMNLELNDLLVRSREIKSMQPNQNKRIVLNEWLDSVEIFCDKYLSGHPLERRLKSLLFHRNSSVYEDVLSSLRAIERDNKGEKSLDDSFLTYACDILADTDEGLSGYKIIEFSNAYATTFCREVIHSSYPFDAPNKRTALKDNIKVFNDKEQFQIIKELCELQIFEKNENVAKLKVKLFQQYGILAESSITNTVLVQQTRHWLEDYPESLKQYNSAATKIEGGIFERNALDDLRLALELLLKSLLENQKSLENQISDLGKMLENAGVSKELRNLLLKTIDYYCKYNNSHVKHDDNINQNEIDFIFEETTIIMKLLVKLFNN